jgi:diguanylate cyclase (GGDEF)-like protein/PAS domain S-box-containing protein
MNVCSRPRQRSFALLWSVVDVPLARAAVIDWSTLIVGSADVNAVTGVDGRYRYLSPACEQLFGWTTQQLEGCHEDELADPDDRATLASRRAELAAHPGQPAMCSYRFRCKDGSFRWVEANSQQLTAEAGGPMVVTALRDITDRQRLNQMLQRQASTDPLTGVANRTVLLDRLQQGLQRLDRQPGVVVVLGLDLDRFKVINDSLGHAVGDAVLLKLAERLQRHLRPTDTLARLGGDEFVIVVEGLSEEKEVADLVNRIIESAREPFLLDGQPLECTLSVGVASTSDSQHDVHELLREADLALYRAKDRGRDRAEYFGHELRTKAVSRLMTERMLRRALDEDRLVVEYQPIIGLPGQSVVGVEALVRVKDERSGLIYPETFLDVAEDTGLLFAIDERVMAEAIGRAGAWAADPERPTLTVAINVTARHLADVGFQRSLLATLSAAGVDPHRIQIEVTERMLLEASNSALNGLMALREAGVQIGLDDFGTGYSSLAYLQQFPLDFLKIDRSFVRTLAESPASLAIVAAIIRVAQVLHLTVVAEGVEAPEQLEALQSLGCDRIQGFLFSPSLNPRELDAYVAAH